MSQTRETQIETETRMPDNPNSPNEWIVVPAESADRLEYVLKLRMSELIDLAEHDAAGEWVLAEDYGELARALRAILQQQDTQIYKNIHYFMNV